MKLYKAGFGEHWHYVGANTDVEAIVKVKNLDVSFIYLPVTATEIKEAFGKEICVLKESEETEFEIETVEKKEEEISKKTPVKRR